MAKQTFEKAIKKLELIVQQLESGEKPLKEAVKKFEEGVQLSKFCSRKLDETEKRIQLLTQDRDGNVWYLGEVSAEPRPSISAGRWRSTYGSRSTAMPAARDSGSARCSSCRNRPSPASRCRCPALRWVSATPTSKLPEWINCWLKRRLRQGNNLGLIFVASYGL